MTPPRPLGRSIADAFAAQAVSATFTLVTAVVTMRVLGPHEYGVLAIVFGFATVAALLCDLGLSMAAARFAAERFESPGAVARVARDALAVKVVLAVIVATAIVALSDPIARALGAGGGVWALRLMAAAAGAQAIFASAIGTLNAVRRTRVSLAAVCAESVVESLGTGVAVLLAGTAAAAAAGRLTGYTAGALVSVVLMARALGLRRPGPRVVTTRALLGYAGAIAVVEGAFVVFTRIDSVLLGPLAGPTAAGQFDAVVRIATLLQYPGLAVAIALAPRFAGRVAAGDRALLGRTLGRLLLLQAALVIPVAVWFGSAAQLGLGGGYAACGVIALAMSPYLLLWGLAPILTMTASYAGLARRRVGAALVTVAVNVVLDLALIPRFGAVGAAIGTDVAFAVYVATHVRLCRTIGLELPCAHRAGRYVAAIAAGAAAGWAASTLPVPLALPLSVAAMPSAALAFGLVGHRAITAWIGREPHAAKAR